MRVPFTWSGAWEFDAISGTGDARLDKDGRLVGKIKIVDGDSSTFVAERTEAPSVLVAGDFELPGHNRARVTIGADHANPPRHDRSRVHRRAVGRLRR